jgi:hypothetical protein
LEFVSNNPADTALGNRLTEDSSRPIAYGIQHVRSMIDGRESFCAELNEHLDTVDNGLVGLLGSREFIEALILASGSFETVAIFYRRIIEDYFGRCESAGLGKRNQRSPLSGFLALIEG